jgi:putative heme-binding domain-containing protein
MKTGLLIAVGMLLLTSAFGQERVPWTTSRFHGTPEPPPPYVVERAFPSLTFDRPMEAATLPGTDRIVVLEQSGRIVSFPQSAPAATTDLVADLREFEPEIQEVYGITFHPKFTENRLAYAWILLKGQGKGNRPDGTRVVQFSVTKQDPPRFDLTSGKVIITWPGGGHNGGNLRFGPDGMLYISTGDGALADPPDSLVTGQDVSDLLGSVLRIDVDRPQNDRPYAIPQDNPFVTLPGARGEVWAYGLRNPWRLAFDPKSGDLYTGDVGWELWEMIYRIQPGGNYGWSITEGTKQDVRPDRLRGPTPILPPLVAHPHEEAASITGGEFYHGTRLPDLRGAYLYGDWQMGTFWSIRAKGDRVTEQREICRSSLMPVGFGIAPDGELLICDHAGGGLWRFAPNPASSRPVDFPTRLSQTGLFTDVAAETPSPGVLPYEVNASRWADHATARRWVGFPEKSGAIVADRTYGVLEAGRWIFPDGAVFAKTYSLELERGNPKSRRKIETQVLHLTGGTVGAAYSYRWNEAQTDAELVPARGDETTFAVTDANAPGGKLNQTWRFFSRAECLRCHSLWNNFAPGFSPLQIDRPSETAPGSQLDALERLGLAPDEPKMADPHGTAGSLEVRARSYLHANCGTCHRNNGGGAVPAYLNIETALKDARILGAPPVQGDFGLPDARLIAPGDPGRSVLLYRMATGGRGHMPYLGGRLVDDPGLRLVRDWIASLKPNPRDPVASAAAAQRSREAAQLKKLLAGDSASLPDLLGSPSGALDVALAISDGRLTGTLRDQVITRGSALADPVRRDLFERHLPESQRRAVLGAAFQPDAVLRKKGAPDRGRALFTVLCAACHRISDQGIDFGPDLSQIGKKWDRAGLLEQIAAPSKVIDPQWQLAAITLKGGGAKAGFIAEKSATTLTLKLPGGLTEKVALADIAKQEIQRVSLMPEGQLQSLTAQEAADLIDYLASLRPN